METYGLETLGIINASAVYRNHEDTIRGTIDQLGKNIGFSLG